MSRETRNFISVAIKFAIFGFALAGILGCLVGPSGGFMSGSVLFKYFTNQSNVWIAVLGLVLGILQLVNMKNGKYELGRVAYVLQLVFTVSITLTGFVFCAVLLPAMLTTSDNPALKESILGWQQIFLHVVVPILAVVDLLGFTKPEKFNYKKFDFLWTALPPLYYLGFSRIGYVQGWDFGGGNNYPYFFLNYDSPAGFFGFSSEMPYFMGVFWWIIAIVIFVFGIAFLYQVLVNRHIRKNREKLI